MSYSLYHVLHLLSVFLLFGLAMLACAASAEWKKGILISAAVSAFIALVSGFGLIAKIKAGFPIWVIIKLLCLAGLTVHSIIVFRMPDSRRKRFLIVNSVVMAVAVVMVSLKPF